jgi:peptidoglycan/LPS O-acetylase OafA/YrhL
MKRPKLPALTSLRFIAAAMILLHHTRDLLSSDTSWALHWHLDHGVSLFFVLSGFILTYSYPSLEDDHETETVSHCPTCPHLARTCLLSSDHVRIHAHSALN